MQDDISVEDLPTFCKRNKDKISRLLDNLITVLYKYTQSNPRLLDWTINMPKSANSNIQPLFSNVLIRPLDAEAKTPSGIILPDSAQEKPTVGEVMAVGEGRVTPKGDKEKMIVSVGDKVMYKKWGGNEVKVEKEERTIVEQKDILAIIK